MGLPYTQEDVERLYGLIGKAVWHLQHLENIVASFTAFKVLQAKRAKGKKLTADDVVKAVENQKKQTLAPLIGIAKSHRTIPPDLGSRFDELLVERNWLIHRCVTDEYLSLRNQSEKQRLFVRINEITEEAIALQNEIHGSFEQWFLDLGYDLKKAYVNVEQMLNRAEEN